MLPSDFTFLDYAAVAWFLSCWFGYTLAADHSPLRRHSMTAAMSGYRRRWMSTMLERENRVVDTTVIGNLLQGTAFFASTTIFAIGGLLAALGATDSAIEILRDLPFAVAPSRSALELKVLLLITTLVFAFFKFAWSFRLFNYCSVLIGAAPLQVEGNPEAEKLASCAANVNSLAARHFNQGVRAYFFALAALGWLVHPVLFMVTVTWVVFVVHRRDFRSRALRFVRNAG
jgi:uncharacterized membrane protein